MGFQLTTTEFDAFLGRAGAGLQVWGPARLPRSGRHSDQEVIGYRQIAAHADLVLDRKSFFSPKELLFPVREVLFEFQDGEAREPANALQPQLIFLRACDLHGIDRLDTLFLRNGPEPDFYYERRRKLVKFILVECPAGGFDSCFCVSMGTNRADDYAAAVKAIPGGVLLQVRDPELLPLLSGLGAAVEFAPAFVEANKIRVNLPDPEKLTPEMFGDPLWKEYTKRCIGCGRCNTSCVTCSCFNMQDVPASPEKPAQRRRNWTGCHLDGFTSMAGGHDFRREYGDRMRFKSLHKVGDFPRRFGKPMCVGCGRCDDVCPEYISFSRCINRLAELVAAKSEEEA